MSTNYSLKEALWAQNYPCGTLFRLSRANSPLLRFVGYTLDKDHEGHVVLVVENVLKRTYHVMYEDVPAGKYEIVKWA